MVSDGSLTPPKRERKTVYLVTRYLIVRPRTAASAIRAPQPREEPPPEFGLSLIGLDLRSKNQKENNGKRKKHKHLPPDVWEILPPDKTRQKNHPSDEENVTMLDLRVADLRFSSAMVDLSASVCSRGDPWSEKDLEIDLFQDVA